MTDLFPWKEAAVVVETVVADEGVDRIVIFEGSLRQAANFLARLPGHDRHRLSVSLPDRRVPPTRFNGLGVERLLTALQRLPE